MDHKVLTLARIVLVVLSIAVVTSAELPAYTQAPLPAAGSGSLSDIASSDPAFAVTSSPVSMPDPILTGAITTPSAPTARSSDDRDNSTDVVWEIG